MIDYTFSVHVAAEMQITLLYTKERSDLVDGKKVRIPACYRLVLCIPCKSLISRMTLKNYLSIHYY